jgi:hypothetical protein
MRFGFNSRRQRWEMWDDDHGRILFILECPSEEEIAWWTRQAKYRIDLQKFLVER